eukprot:gene11900-5306_t
MGFEIKSFVKQPPAWLICKDCNRVLEDCVKLKNKRYCQKCATIYQENETFEFDLEMNTLIDNLQVFCKNKRLKCHWIGKNSELKQHSKICEFRLLNCKHCDCLYPFNVLKKHEKECIKCETCQKTIENKMNKKEMEMEIMKLKLENERLSTLNVHDIEIEKLKLENFNLKIENEKITKDEKNILLENINLKEQNSKLKFDLEKNFDQIFQLSKQIEEFKKILNNSINFVVDKEIEENPSILNQMDELIEEKKENEKKIKSLKIQNEKLKNECTLLISKNSDINKSLLNEIEKLKNQNEIYEKKLKNEMKKEENILEESSLNWIIDPFIQYNLKLNDLVYKNILWQVKFESSKKSFGFSFILKDKPKNNGYKTIISLKINEEELFKETLLFFNCTDKLGCPNLIRKKDIQKYCKNGKLNINIKVLKLEII